MDIGVRIRELRTRRDMTLEELADASGYSLDYVWKAEKGRKNPSPAFLEKVASALGAQYVATMVEANGPALLVREENGGVVIEESCSSRGNSKDLTLREDGRAEECPTCGEDRFEDDWRYCYACGQALYNFCLAPARHINPPKARRCVKCGRRTFWDLSPEELETLDIEPEPYTQDTPPVSTQAD